VTGSSSLAIESQFLVPVAEGSLAYLFRSKTRLAILWTTNSHAVYIRLCESLAVNFKIQLHG